jgi:phosphoserine phosphatase
VCFDVDSTVCQDEAIDEVARFCGVYDEVSNVTRNAMNGDMTFREALTERLAIIKPHRQTLDRFLRTHPCRLTPGIESLVAKLHARGTDVYLVSGGFSFAILPLAARLAIPEKNVFANVLQFDESGAYSGFDKSQPTSDSGGKPTVCDLLKRRFGYQNLVMVGDGATDMEASPPADAFIGFGGNQVRQNVKDGSDWFVMSFQELIDALPGRTSAASTTAETNGSAQTEIRSE